MQQIALKPYRSLHNPLSVKLSLAALGLLLLAFAPSVVIFFRSGVSLALAGSGVFFLVLGLLAVYCFWMALRIPGGFEQLRLEQDALVCVSPDAEVAIPASEIHLLLLDKVVAEFIGYELVITHNLQVVQIAVATRKHDLEPLYETLTNWLETVE